MSGSRARRIKATPLLRSQGAPMHEAQKKINLFLGIVLLSHFQLTGAFHYVDYKIFVHQATFFKLVFSQILKQWKVRVTYHPEEPFKPLSVVLALQLALLCREDLLGHKLARGVQIAVKVLSLKVNNSHIVPALILPLAKDERAKHIPSLYSPSRAFPPLLPTTLQGSFRNQERSAHCPVPQAQLSWHCLFINSPARNAFSLGQAECLAEVSFLLLVKSLQMEWFLNLGIDCYLCGSAVLAV